MKRKKDLKCPFCKQKLMLGEKKSYETLMDHVCDPNMENHPRRDTYVCTCTESNGCFWDAWGGLYSREFKIRRGFTSAINSGARKCDEQFKRERMLRKCTIGRLILKIEACLFTWKCRVVDMKYKFLEVVK